jgi:hypothetical protein
MNLVAKLFIIQRAIKEQYGKLLIPREIDNLLLHELKA